TVSFGHVVSSCVLSRFFCFFSNAPATTPIYTLSLHDALPISRLGVEVAVLGCENGIAHGHGHLLECDALPVLCAVGPDRGLAVGDRKSTRLNSSHLGISYAVFCLKKKKNKLCMRSSPTR